MIHEDPQAPQKADVAVAITSKPLRVGPNLPVTHTYRVFTGPKTFQALAPYGAEDLASYRKNQWTSASRSPARWPRTSSRPCSTGSTC